MQGVGKIDGVDWLGLALAADLATITSAGYANRTAIPGYPSGTTPPPSAPPSAPAQ